MWKSNKLGYESEKTLDGRIRDGTMKHLVLVIIISAIILCSCSCVEKESDKPDDSNFEFWITESVKDFDFSEYQQKDGMMGGDKYYGIGYIPTRNEIMFKLNLNIMCFTQLQLIPTIQVVVFV